MPSYVIFADAALRDMTAKRPQTLAELSQINGVGERKLAAFGEAFLKVIREN